MTASDPRLLETRAQVRDWHRSGPHPVGLVPTMGFLHEGHLSLVREARRECERVMVSIFVNPAQFDRGSDLESYPRDLDRDLELLAAEGCDAVFLPQPQEIYPPGFQTWVECGAVAEPNEGTHRPGHFRGVATVVLKLFNIVEPDKAYFGRKDAQQLAVVQTLTRDLDLPVEIVPVETVREPDGLAMSSRNALLSTDERRAATVLFRGLSAARDAFRAGERDAGRIRRIVHESLSTEPLARADYVSVADPESFEELERVNGRAVLSLAVFLGPVRLIDNLLLEESR